MSDSSNSSSGANPGNTKQDSQCVRWCFTLNNYKSEDVEKIKLVSSNSSKYWLFGFEVGEKGTPHLQGYVELKKKARLTEIKKLYDIKEIHWEKCKGKRESNLNYCTKDKHYYLNGIESKPLKVITSLYPWQEKVYNLLKEEPDDRTIHWVYERKGNVGKTALLKYIYVKHEKETLILCGKANDMKNGIVQFHKTNGYYPKIILFNLPRSFNCDHLSLPGIEEIKDGLFYCGKYEGGMVCMNSPHIIIMSNTPFEQVVEDISVNRWNIIHI